MASIPTLKHKKVVDLLPEDVQDYVEWHFDTVFANGTYEDSYEFAARECESLVEAHPGWKKFSVLIQRELLRLARRG